MVVALLDLVYVLKVLTRSTGPKRRGTNWLNPELESKATMQ
jgi:hypothetical protein